MTAQDTSGLIHKRTGIRESYLTKLVNRLFGEVGTTTPTKTLKHFFLIMATLLGPIWWANATGRSSYGHHSEANDLLVGPFACLLSWCFYPAACIWILGVSRVVAFHVNKELYERTTPTKAIEAGEAFSSPWSTGFTLGNLIAIAVLLLPSYGLYFFFHRETHSVDGVFYSLIFWEELQLFRKLCARESKVSWFDDREDSLISTNPGVGLYIFWIAFMWTFTWPSMHSFDSDIGGTILEFFQQHPQLSFIEQFLYQHPYVFLTVCAAFPILSFVREWRRNDRSPDTHMSAAFGKTMSGDVKGSIDSYNRAIQLDPNFACAYKERALARVQLGDHEGANEDLNRAIQIDPLDRHAYSRRVHIRRALGDQAGADDDFDQYIKLDPKGAIEDFDQAIRFQELFIEFRRKPEDRLAREQYLQELKSLYSNELETATQQKRKNSLDRLAKIESELRGLDYEAEDRKRAEGHKRRAAVRLKLGDTEGADSDMAIAKRLDGEPTMINV